jgi:hypothetical protein
MQGYDAGRIFDGETAYPLDDAQLFLAIWNKAAADGLAPRLTLHDYYDEQINRLELWRGERRFEGTGPTPLSAALAAVEELSEETT